MMEVFHLFPPLDQLTAEAKACALHMEALSASQLVLEQLLEHILPGHANEKEEQLHSTHTDEVGDGDMESGELEDSNFPSLEPESDLIPSVTDEMRMVDKQSRLQVLLKLLQLACVMVRTQIQIKHSFIGFLLTTSFLIRLGMVMTSRFCLPAPYQSYFELPLLQTASLNSTNRNYKSK